MTERASGIGCLLAVAVASVKTMGKSKTPISLQK